MPISGAASPLALPVLNLPATGGGTRHASDARRGHGQASGWARKHRIHGRHQCEGKVRKTGCRIYRQPTQSGYPYSPTP